MGTPKAEMERSLWISAAQKWISGAQLAIRRNPPECCVEKSAGQRRQPASTGREVSDKGRPIWSSFIAKTQFGCSDGGPTIRLTSEGAKALRTRLNKYNY
jgi:hypothetical protein